MHFRTMHRSYYDWEWTWSCERIEEEEGKRVETFTADDIIRIVGKMEEKRN